MKEHQPQQSKQQQEFNSVYDRRRRASLEDARLEAEVLSHAISRISSSVDECSTSANQSFAAGKLYEIANELGSAETAYRRSLVADPELQEAAVRLVIVLTKMRRFDEAIQIGNDLFLKAPAMIFKSLVYQGPLSLCTVMGDAYRLSGDFAVAAGFYREAAKLEGSTPYAVNQAVVTMALSGEGRDISQFAEKHSSAYLSERVSSVVRLSKETDNRFVIIKQIAARANVASAESLWVNPMDLVVQPV